MKTQWIIYKNKKILHVDCSNLVFDAAEIKAELGMAISLATREPLDSVLSLTDMRGTKVTNEIYALLKDTAAKIAPHAHKRAVVGVTGVQRTLLELINKLAGKKTFSAFDDIEAAKNWLIAE